MPKFVVTNCREAKSLAYDTKERADMALERIAETEPCRTLKVIEVSALRAWLINRKLKRQESQSRPFFSGFHMPRFH